MIYLQKSRGVLFTSERILPVLVEGYPDPLVLIRGRDQKVGIGSPLVPICPIYRHPFIEGKQRLFFSFSLLNRRRIGIVTTVNTNNALG